MLTSPPPFQMKPKKLNTDTSQTSLNSARSGSINNGPSFLPAIVSPRDYKTNLKNVPSPVAAYKRTRNASQYSSQNPLNLEALNESGVFPAPNEAVLERVLDYKNLGGSKQLLQAATAHEKLNLMLIRG